MHGKSKVGKSNNKHKSKKSVPSNTTDGDDSSSKKSYAGLNVNSIKCMWEQYDKSDTEIASDVLARLAEDATYKLYEVANTIKTFSKKSGGRVTFDLVNEVLKDANVAPVLGPQSSPWDRIEYDGVCFFNYDEIIDLQEEYTKDVVIEQSGPLTLSTSWAGDASIRSDLIELFGNLVDAIFTGDEELFKTALLVTANSPHIVAMLKLLLGKCIEMLAFQYTNDTLERCLKFLNALTLNSSTQNASIGEELSKLSQIFESLLLGPEIVDQHSAVVKMEYSEADATREEEDLKNVKVEEPETVDINEIKKECEELLMMMESGELLKKDEPQMMDGFEALPNCSNDDIRFEISTTQPEEKMEDNVSINISVVSSEPESKADEDESPVFRLRTVRCDDVHIEQVCQTIGFCAAHWGNVEQECLYLFTKRLERFFSLEINWTFEDFSWISRIALGLWSLGEFAFRELTVYFHRIDPGIVPDFYRQIFNRAGIFLQGRSDIFFYEWLQELCGDSLLPFMIHYPHCVQNRFLKIRKAIIRQEQNPESYKIYPKIEFKILQKTEIRQSLNHKDAFPAYKEIKKAEVKKFAFRFAGCRPLSVKLRKVKQISFEMPSFKQNIGNYLNKVVVARRRLLRPIINTSRRQSYAQYHLLTI